VPKNDNRDAFVIAIIVFSLFGAWAWMNRPRPEPPQNAALREFDLSPVIEALETAGERRKVLEARLAAMSRDIERLQRQNDDLRCLVTYQAERVHKPIATHWPWSNAWPDDWEQCARCGAGHQCNRAKEE
jgi:hypothetical protein